jgi:hypothetical protein
VFKDISVCKLGDASQDAFQYFLENSLFAESSLAVKVHQTAHQAVIA